MYYRMTDGQFEHLKSNPQDGVYYGCLYYGALCFDIVVREYTPDSFDPDFMINNMVVDLDCYILGVDSGYGYLDDDTPYDFYEYCGTSVPIPKNLSKNNFLSICDKEIKSFIKICHLEEFLEYKELKWIHHVNMKEVKKYENA